MDGRAASLKINPKVFKWIMANSGWNPEEVAEKTKISTEEIYKMQSVESTVRVVYLKRIAKVLKRPLEIFFLPEPPIEQMLPNFRKAAGTEYNPSKNTFEVIRKARYLQSVARELLVMQGASQQPSIKNYAQEDDPEEVADAERDSLGLGVKTGLLSVNMSSREFYNELRRRVEALNIFVCQDSLNLKETRGFTLSDELPCVAVINTADDYGPRIFTLMHEYAHILLKKNGICNPDRVGPRGINNNEHRIEVWCNEFAGHILMPRDVFVECVEKYKQSSPETMLKKLSNKFHVSKWAVSVQFDKLGIPAIHGEIFSGVSLNVVTDKQKQKGGPNPVTMCISRKGRRFVTLVLDSKEKQLINYGDVVDYLDLGLPHLEKIQQEA